MFTIIAYLGVVFITYLVLAIVSVDCRRNWLVFFGSACMLLLTGMFIWAAIQNIVAAAK